MDTWEFRPFVSPSASAAPLSQHKSTILCFQACNSYYVSANAECLIQLDCTRGGGGGGLVGGGDWAPRSRRRLLLKEAVFLRAAPDQGRETPLTRPCISCTATLPAWACFHTLEVSSICPCSAWASWTRKFMRSMCALYNTRSCMLSAAAVSAPAVAG